MSEEWACGWATPEQRLGGPEQALLLYVVDGSKRLACHPYADGDWGAPVTVSEGVDGIIGVWSGVDENLGVLFDQGSTVHLWSPSPLAGKMPPLPVPTDFALTNAVVWQDARGMMHIYGLSGGQLRVVHKTGWGATVDGVVLPEFVSVFAGTFGNINLSLPLRASVAWFAVDRFPDTFPTQFVHREGVRVEEACSILTQDTTTTWWSEETITATTDKRRVVDRYVSTITVSDRYGAPVAGAEVTLSAESRTEVEIGPRAAGGPWHPARGYVPPPTCWDR